MKLGFRKNTGSKKKGFTFVEIMITFSLFMLLASMGFGSYLRYYRSSLISNDITKISKVLHEARFKAMKNPYHSDYGIHLGTASRDITIFRDSYMPGHEENQVTEFEQLSITDIDLQPFPGTTTDIIFENPTGKSQNTGSFTISKDEFTYTYYINAQGAFE